ncbi:MAG: hypothetical protein DMG71_16475 [Acidobacteria bacterium]|jgi:hypothetical protein|nr:MAG: hypothetical protein DMG71_16475 [Acidobacteriota bacterium]
MAANQVVLYFENQEDALRFTLAAGTVLADDKPTHNVEDLLKVAREMGRASRITASGTLSG